MYDFMIGPGENRSGTKIIAWKHYAMHVDPAKHFDDKLQHSNARWFVQCKKVDTP